jgi:protein gp37
VKFADENDGRLRRVFIQSMSDLFDLEVYDEWFAGAWARIEEEDCLDIQIVTKRISAVEKRLVQVGCTKWPQHAGLIITVVNQAEADRDIPRLLTLKARFKIPWVGLSIEPLLGAMVLTRCGSHYTGSGPLHLWRAGGNQGRWHRQHTEPPPEVDWVIVGGESGFGARPMHPDWARSLRDQCAVAGVPFLFKQRGEYTWIDSGVDYDASKIPDLPENWRDRTDDKFICMRADGSRADGYGGDSAEFLYRVGRKAAGRLLDGVTHDGFPEVRT